MRISPYSLITAIIVCSIYFSIICIYRKRFRFTKKGHVTTFTLLYVIGFVRLLLPIDFPFTRGINLEGHFSTAWQFLFDDRLIINRLEISIIDFIVGIILLISFVRMVRFLFNYVKELSLLKILNPYDSVQIGKIHKEISSIIPKMPSFKIVKSEFVNMPSVVGIFKRYVILPDMDFNDKELFYVLLHEIEHIRRWDLMKKFLVCLFRCVFWWIPFSSFVTRDLEQMMEIKCDYMVTRILTEQEKSSYMRTMLTCLKKASLYKRDSSSSLAFALKENQEAVLERFKIMTSTDNKKMLSRVVMIISIVVVVITYFFVPFPYFQPTTQDVGEEAVLLTNDNTYLIYEDGVYYMIVENADSMKLSAEEAEVLMSIGVEVKEINNE